MSIQVFNQASIKLTSDKIIYFDPYQLVEEKHDADIIFITHDHYDHFEETSITKALNDNTVLVVPTILEEKASTITSNIFVVEPNKTYTLTDITFETVPSYNHDIMGDTGRTEESDRTQTDICLVPIGGTYTMNVEEAATYINDLKPKKVIPIHYGSIVGAKSLGQDFKKLINKEIEVEIQI